MDYEDEEICVYCDVNNDPKCLECDKSEDCGIVCYLRLSLELRSLHKKTSKYNKITLEKGRNNRKKWAEIYKRNKNSVFKKNKGDK